VAENLGSESCGCRDGCRSDPDLALVITAWPQLPSHIKAAVLALVGVS
jgi:hypothetical protein